MEIKNLRLRLDRQQSADKTVLDIQAVLDQGRGWLTTPTSPFYKS
jgi:hypothetical protein